jgi:hypothetical protein
MTIELINSSNKLKLSQQKPAIFPEAAPVSNFGDYDAELRQIWANSSRDWNIYSSTEITSRFWDNRIKETRPK